MAKLDSLGPALYAALSESVYRRNEKDQPLALSYIKDDLTAVELTNQPAGLEYDQNGGYYYVSTGDMAGFHAQIVRDGNTYIVVFRGTDGVLSGWNSVLKNTINGITNAIVGNPTGNLYQGVVDAGDAWSNRSLAFGSAEAVTQWDAVRILMDALAAQVGINNVVVTGQSLGGGLAGLASQYYNIEGFVFAPAPFGKQLVTEAKKLAATDAISQFSSYFRSEFFGLSNQLQYEFIDNIGNLTLDPADISDYLVADTKRGKSLNTWICNENAGLLRRRSARSDVRAGAPVTDRPSSRGAARP